MRGSQTKVETPVVFMCIKLESYFAKFCSCEEGAYLGSGILSLGQSRETGAKCAYCLGVHFGSASSEACENVYAPAKDQLL